MSGSADAVEAREAFGQEADEEGGGETDHVQVVAFDPLDERGAESLDRVRARAVLPFARRDVRSEIASRQGPERDTGDLVVKLLPAGGDEAEPRDDLVCRAGQRPEHLGSVLGAGSLAVDATGADDRGVDPEHRPVAGPVRNRAGL